MKAERRIIIVYVLLAILNIQFNSVSAKQNTEQSVTEVRVSATQFAPIVQNGESQYDVTLWVKDWKEKIAFSNLNVTVYDSGKKVVDSKFTNSTGHVFLSLKANSYIVSVGSGDRLVGYQVINVTQSETLIVRTWAYDLNATFVDRENQPLANHEIFLYDQIVVQPSKKYTIVANQVGRLIGKMETDGNGTLCFSGVWNGTYRIKDAGQGAYGWHILNLQEPLNLTLKPYDLTIKCVDQAGKPLPDHIVFLYDELVFYKPPDPAVMANQTGLLLNWTETDEDGTAYFNNVWNGTYNIRVVGGELIGEKIVNFQEVEPITIVCKKTRMVLTFTSWSAPYYPLDNATVYIQNSAGRLIFRERTDKSGSVFHEGMYLGNYTVFVEVIGTQVWSGVLDISRNNEVTIRCPVYYFTIRLVDQFGSILPNTDLTLRKRMTTSGRQVFGPAIELETDDSGRCSSLLPSGMYEMSASKRVYSTTIIINVLNDEERTISCGIQLIIYLMTFLVAFPLVGLTLVLERKRVKTPMNVKRYRNMLFRLESMYNNGLVEYKIYRKLKEEYEAKLMELGGREMR